MSKEKINALWHDVETWRFIAFTLLGVVLGLFFMANAVIDTTIDLTNDARLELYKMQHPQQEKSYALNTSQLEGISWPIK